uniref:Late embryogenesis abundant protein ECP63-like domain-containing protein n=1 Tax=Nelumbo nucifera TaxID=4432 RepID=A0A822YBH6_NELNU|nr:TPA_asm: hypothetical protein HUJ06_030127 [Nelumbo nucifera]
MASRQAKEERAERAARVAASELKDVRNRDYDDELAGADFDQDQPQQRRGLLGSIQEGTSNVLKAVQGAVTGKSQEAADRTREGAEAVGERARETKDAAGDRTKQAADAAGDRARGAKDYVAGKAGETRDAAAGVTRKAVDTAAGGAQQAKDKMGEFRDYTAEKARETKDATVDRTGDAADKARQGRDAAMNKMGEYKDYTADKAKQGKDATMEKMGEYRDYTAEKAKEGKDSTTGAITNLKDTAAGATRRAMGFLTGRKDDANQQEADTEKTAKKLGEAEEAARQKIEDLRLRGEEYKNEAERKAAEARTTAGSKAGDVRGTIDPKAGDASDRGTGSAGRGNIFSPIGNVAGAIKDKLIGPKEVVKHRTEHSGEEGGGERIRIEVETAPIETGEAERLAENRLKASDQMAGQTFNDVGPLGGEGTGRTDRQGKM